MPLGAMFAATGVVEGLGRCPQTPMKIFGPSRPGGGRRYLLEGVVLEA
jgi:hypothetical protein